MMTTQSSVLYAFASPPASEDSDPFEAVGGTTASRQCFVSNVAWSPTPGSPTRLGQFGKTDRDTIIGRRRQQTDPSAFGHFRAEERGELPDPLFLTGNSTEIVAREFGAVVPAASGSIFLQ